MVKKIGIVSLSSGIVGEDYVKHEVAIGVERLEQYGIEVQFMNHALAGEQYVKNHYKERAQDLIDALSDDTIDMILCSFGGDDTYQLLPYLFEDDVLKNAVKGNEKIFLGYSDTTINHLMFYKVGMNTYYGQAFLSDVCELDKEMMPYTRKYFEELLFGGTISEIVPSDIWYTGRKDFSVESIGTPNAAYLNEGFISLQGAMVFEGKILGGCIDTLFDIFDNTRYSDSVEVCRRYDIFPSLDDWKDKILLLETSEEQPKPEHFRKQLSVLKKEGVFSVIKGILFGKPMDEKYMQKYHEILVDVVSNPSLPIAANINVGHAAPRCIIPFGVMARVDVNKQWIRFGENPRTPRNFWLSEETNSTCKLGMRTFF